MSNGFISDYWKHCSPYLRAWQWPLAFAADKGITWPHFGGASLLANKRESKAPETALGQLLARFLAAV